MPKRRLIYLPDHLAERLETADGFNVSAVCQRAIETELDKRESTIQVTSNIAQVAARLRQTRSDEYATPFVRGREIGIRWARETATLPELEEVVAVSKSRLTWFTLTAEHSLVETLAEEDWWPDGVKDPTSFDRRRGDGFITGLLQGAAEVYRAAAPHLDT